ncbi:MAG: S-layer homology domain-containing protein [Candidatus Gracilibacteria bacterium]
MRSFLSKHLQKILLVTAGAILAGFIIYLGTGNLQSSLLSQQVSSVIYSENFDSTIPVRWWRNGWHIHKSDFSEYTDSGEMKISSAYTVLKTLPIHPQPGASYTLKFVAKRDKPGSTRSYVRLYYTNDPSKSDNSPIGDKDVYLNETWQQVSYTFKVPQSADVSDNMTIEINADGNAHLMLDELTFTEEKTLITNINDNIDVSNQNTTPVQNTNTQNIENSNVQNTNSLGNNGQANVNQNIQNQNTAPQVMNTNLNSITLSNQNTNTIPLQTNTNVQIQSNTNQSVSNSNQNLVSNNGVQTNINQVILQINTNNTSSTVVPVITSSGGGGGGGSYNNSLIPVTNTTQSPSKTDIMYCPPTCPTVSVPRDLSAGHFARSAILFLVSAKVMQGYPGGDIRPDNPINRAEISKILQVGFQMEDTGTTISLPFKDVGIQEWYYTSLVTLYKKALLKGYPDGTFKPAQYALRAEAIKMLALALYDESGIISRFNTWKSLHPTYAYTFFQDVPSDAWYAPYLFVLAEDEVVKGRNANGKVLFYPADMISRGEFAVLLARIIEQKNIQYPNS